MAVKRVWGSLQICCCSACLCTCQKSLFKCTQCLKSEIRSGCTIAPNSTETWSAWKEEISQCTKSGADNIPSENETDEIHSLIKIPDLPQSFLLETQVYIEGLCCCSLWRMKFEMVFNILPYTVFLLFFHSTFFNLWKQRSYWVGTTFYVIGFHAAIDFPKEKKNPIWQ